MPRPGAWVSFAAEGVGVGADGCVLRRRSWSSRAGVEGVADDSCQWLGGWWFGVAVAAPGSEGAGESPSGRFQEMGGTVYTSRKGVSGRVPSVFLMCSFCLLC